MGSQLWEGEHFHHIWRNPAAALCLQEWASALPLQRLFLAHLAPYLYTPFWQLPFLVCYQQCFQRFPYPVLDIAAKHTNDSDLCAPNWISKVDPPLSLFSPTMSVIMMYFLKCSSTTPKLSTNPTEDDTSKSCQEKASTTKQLLLVSEKMTHLIAMMLFLQAFQKSSSIMP